MYVYIRYCGIVLVMTVQVEVGPDKMGTKIGKAVAKSRLTPKSMTQSLINGKKLDSVYSGGR